MLTEKYLKQLDSNTEDNGVVLEESLPLISDVVGAKDRELLLKITFQQYIAQLPFLPLSSLIHCCVVATKFSSSGFTFSKDLKSIIEDKKMSLLGEQFPFRIHLATTIQSCLVDIITFCLFKSQTKKIARDALDAISSRASYDLQTQILLETNALKHILLKEQDT